LFGWMNAFGIDPLKLRLGVRNLRPTIEDYRLITRQNRVQGQGWLIEFHTPYLADRHEAGGSATGHYFHQDLLVARRVFERKPERHVDVGSRVDGFVAHVAVFREIEVFDIRKVDASVQNIKFVQRDFMNEDAVEQLYCDSLSCLHALEHFGLGRYGDTLDLEGYKKGFRAISRMLKPDGILYLSVPIGRERIEFNGQRVFSIKRVLEMAAGQYELIAFSHVDDDGELHEFNSVPRGFESIDQQMEFGCGIFELKKLAA
jgi:SAM-dependent methyltransferase